MSNSAFRAASGRGHFGPLLRRLSHTIGPTRFCTATVGEGLDPPA